MVSKRLVVLLATNKQKISTNKLSNKLDKPTCRCTPCRLDVVYYRRCLPLPVALRATPSDTAALGVSLYAKRSDGRTSRF